MTEKTAITFEVNKEVKDLIPELIELGLLARGNNGAVRFTGKTRELAQHLLGSGFTETSPKKSTKDLHNTLLLRNRVLLKTFRALLGAVSRQPKGEQRVRLFIAPDKPKLVIPPEKPKLFIPPEKPSKKKRRRKFTQPTTAVFIPKKVQPFIDIWNELGGRKITDLSTKGAHDAVTALKKLIRGSFFDGKLGVPAEYQERRFTIEEWEKSLVRFDVAKRDNRCKPLDKKLLMTMPLRAFMHNNFGAVRSTFIKFLEGPPEPLRAYPRQENEQLTQALIDIFNRKVLGNITYEPNVDDRRKFIKGANRIWKFILSHRKRIFVGRRLPTPADVARWVWESIESETRNDPQFLITPGWFSSDTTLHRRLPSYLVRNAILDSSKKPKSLEQYTDVTVPKELWDH